MGIGDSSMKFLAARAASGQASLPAGTDPCTPPGGGRNNTPLDQAQECRPDGWSNTCRRNHACIAIGAAAPALIERVEPNWAISRIATEASRACGESPG